MFTDVVVSLLNPQNVGERVHIHLGGGRGHKLVLFQILTNRRGTYLKGHFFEGEGEEANSRIYSDYCLIN